MTTEDKLRRFIIDELQFPDEPGRLTAEYELLDSGTLDSLGIYAVVTFCEDEYGVQIDDEELVPENFATLGDIARLVRSKQAAA
jgi:acyl carrier protein